MYSLEVVAQLRKMADAIEAAADRDCRNPSGVVTRQAAHELGRERREWPLGASWEHGTVEAWLEGAAPFSADDLMALGRLLFTHTCSHCDEVSYIRAAPVLTVFARTGGGKA